ncbi:hypothetical protein F5J12DRAFT_829285 [Pisolithus orientalis]|uniref:uncharacterized protein n=1 Tax=Pisolithus orientalis TaxID=936130 RepID=UPI00222592EF|nr:uncharacterized protein F5J12DRAFT_829285 [Pisolithus orientalis]KAI6007610.1 hypothetical protein F5J12DRAFT_829285 [Pisolithus orientalis]
MLLRVNLVVFYFFIASLNLFAAANPLPAIVPYTEGVQLFKDVIARGEDIVVTEGVADVDNDPVKRGPEAAPDPLPGEDTDVDERFCRFGCL